MLIFKPRRQILNDEPTERYITWSPQIGTFVGIVFVVAGVLIVTNVLGSHWWVEPRVRLILGITVILFGIYRIVTFLPKLREERQKTLREQIDELDQK